MAATTNKAVLFLLGGVAAAAAVAYGAGLFGPPKPETIAALPEAGQADQKDARLPEPPAAAAPQPSEPEAAAPVEPSTQAEPATPQADAPAAPATQAVIAPSFDVVRVEGNGSIVIAGKAAPDAKVDLLVGSNVIGSATASPGGDFAVVLEDPLKPGNYQIVLRATAPDNVVAMSVETAVVSVPETSDGQVLALVEEPGKPSQMITLPKPQAAADDVKQPETAAPPAAEAPVAEEAPAAAEPKPESEMQAALPEQTQPAPAPAAPPPAGPAVRVEAVEIDGRKIFVAGAADPGRTVRGYANEILLGDAKASPDGRYLIEADRNLPVGDYIIRVDALEPDGVKVAARAAVPFEREPGETIAAVVPPAAAAPAPQQPAAGAPTTQPPASGTASAPAPASEAIAPAAPGEPAAPSPAATEAQSGQPAGEQAPAAAPASPAPEAPAAVAETTPPPAASALQSAEPPTDDAAVAEPPASQAEAQAMATPDQPAASDTGTPAAEQPAAPAETPASPPTVAPAVNPPAAGAAASDAPAAGEPAPPAAGEPETDVAAGSAENGTLPLPPAAGVTETLAPKLQSVDSAVIIRRGDTLWRISRRVYGRGVRYSTIYLANQTQIEDPDRIWPGQVFKVPEKSNDGKADADYSTLGNRLTTVPADGPEAAPVEAQQ